MSNKHTVYKLKDPLAWLIYDYIRKADGMLTHKELRTLLHNDEKAYRKLGYLHTLGLIKAYKSFDDNSNVVLRLTTTKPLLSSGDKL